MLTYAIGDIHGCKAELEALLRKVETHAGNREFRVVFLGDYIDRGPDSAGCVEIVRGYMAAGHIALSGNHEDMLVQTVDAPLDPSWWLGNGGAAALRSWGGEVPADVLEWMRPLPTLFEDEHRIFVHAGLLPGPNNAPGTHKPIKDQPREIRLWIRGDFLDSDYDFGKLVVHGHTPDGLENLPTRVNLDTACVFGGALTAAVFSDAQREPLEFLEVRRGAA